MTKTSGHDDTKILIDWLRFTVGMDCFFDDVSSEDENRTSTGVFARIEELLFLSGLEWMEGGNLYGYRLGWVCGGIRICWGGNDDTVMFDFSGEGCRLYESLRGESLDWFGLIQTIQSFRRHNISRLDVACDTFGLIKMSQVMKYTAEHRYLTVYKSVPRLEMLRREIVEFGSRNSNVMLRIYNKTLERIQKADLPPQEVPTDWVRLEFELKNEGCDAFIRSWQSTGDIGTSYFGLMSNQLTFLKNRESNLCRSEPAAWWRRFVGNTKRIPLAYQGGLEYNLQSLRKYVIGQAGSSIRTYLEVTDGDLSGLLESVKYRPQNPRQRDLIAKMRVGEES